jgi:hypothetical protein
MLEFPKLKTGALCQYPGRTQIARGTRVFRFLDGSEQRYTMRRRRMAWKLTLRQLDAREAAEVDAFVTRYQSTLEHFAFTDPRTGERYENCVIHSDAVSTTLAREHDWQTELVIAEAVE